MNVGDKYGEWTVLELTHRDTRPAARVVCKCGVEYIHFASNLKTGNTTKCRACSYADRGPLVNKRITGDHLAAKDKYSDYKVKAKKRGIEFNLDFETFKKVAKENCYYCGEEPSNVNRIPDKEWADDFVYSGLDRLDNGQGYHSQNVVPACKYCNYMKRELSYSEFFERVHKISVKWPPESVIVIIDCMNAEQPISKEHVRAMVSHYLENGLDSVNPAFIIEP